MTAYDFTEIDGAIEQGEAAFIEMLQKLLRQKSISHTGEGMEECAESVRLLLEQEGFLTTVYRPGAYPIVYGEISASRQAADAPTVLLYGHYDVMPPDPLNEWKSDPFEPRIRDGKIYARGAGDNKGQFLAHILAVRNYLKLHGGLPINLKILIEGEEETGSPSLADFVANHRGLLKADLVYTSDGPKHASGAPAVLLGVRGALSVRLTSKEAAWDNHSGNKGNIVPNPVWPLISLLHGMRSDDGTVQVEGFYDGIPQVSEADAEALRRLPFDLGDLQRQVGHDGIHMDGETYYRRLSLEPTFNVFGLHAGGRDKGIIPAEAEAYLDVRLVSGQDPLDIYAKLERHVRKHAPSINIERIMSVPPSKTPIDLPIVRAVIRTVTEACALEPVVQPAMGGTLPDYVWTSVLGAPSVVVPYAPYDEANHSPNENTGIADFLEGIRCTYHLIRRLGEPIDGEWE